MSSYDSHHYIQDPNDSIPGFDFFHSVLVAHIQNVSLMS